MECENRSFSRTKYQKSYPVIGLIFAVIMVSFLSAGECQAVTLTITADNGSVTATPAKADYNIGEVVELIPKPDTGYCFTGWTGDARGKMLVLNLTMDSNKSIIANFDIWQPPIGIQAPSFGIDEAYRMYDTVGNRNGDLTYRNDSVADGYYTHYVDGDSGSDDDNPYGTVASPRKKIPTDLPAGSIVEVHGSSVQCAGPLNSIKANGTQEQPVFVRGVSEALRPEICRPAPDTALTTRFQGSYMIVENFYFHETGIQFTIHNASGLYGVDHVAVRYCEFEGKREIGEYGAVSAVSSEEGEWVTDIVIYDNEIHHYGDSEDMETQTDTHGIAVTIRVQRFWLLDNHIHHNGGNGFQVNAQNVKENAAYLYIGRNVFHDDRETAVGLKACSDSITSENLIYNYEPSASSVGAGIRVEEQGEKENIWVIYNTIHDCASGVNPINCEDPSYIIGNVIYGISAQGINSQLSASTGCVINNTFYNTDVGIRYGKNVINNIIYNATTWHLYEGTNVHHNLFWQDVGDINFKQITSADSIEEDPLFVDPANCDFRLQASSIAIDAGISSGVVQQVFDTFQTLYGIDIRKDIEGTSRPQGLARDIGAYETVIDPGNPPPVLDAIGDKSIGENAALIFTINATDPDGEPITYLVQGLPGGATLDSQTGDFTWTPSYSQAGSYQVRFIASDGNSCDSETITITVTNVNRPPVLGAISDPSVDENNLLNISVNATDPDGQALTYSVSGLPAGAVFAGQTFIWTPSYDQAGNYAVTFTADDGQDQDSQVVTITVNNVNRAPVLTAIGNKSVWSDDPLTFTIDATDPDGDAVTYSADTVPGGATFITETFDWTPTAAQIGSYDVTFYVSDGQLQDSEAITITVNVDSLAPTVTNLSPAAGAIQVPLNNLVTLNVTDPGKGVNADSVKIKVRINENPNNDTIYFGDLDHDITLLGDCRRIGNNADYQFIFQPAQDLFYNDQTITITVNAADLAGNVMDEYSYSFVTEMHLFGQNKLVNTSLDNNDRPVTVCDSSGNIWAAWHTGSAGSRDIYIGMLAAGADNFGSIIQLTNNENDQCNPALALDSKDKLYAVWQDNREGDWDIYISTSVDGINWSTETRVNDPNNGNQVNPVIVIDSQSPNYAHVVWRDDRAGNQDICIASSSDGFITKAISQVTSDTSDQVEPAVTVDSANTIYVIWTDGRNGSSDIYGAASNNGPWTNVAIVSNASNQSSPTIAAESTGSILHLLWVDDAQGDNDIYYASSDGLPGSPLNGSSIIDELGSNQLDPTITLAGTTANYDLKVFACWQDWRNTDTDLYFVELNAGSGTNVFVNDGGSNAYQSEPAMGIDEYGYPYLIWADDRNTNTDIYYTASTFIEPVALASALVSASAPGSTIIGVDPQAINDVDDISVVLPAGACLYDVDISIVAILNQQVFATPCYGSYDFGPSGIQFSQPVTITIPYVYASSNGSTVPYWFNSLTGTLSQQGITNIRDIVISPTLRAISFETTHFTPFYLLGGSAAGAISGGGGGGGGCSVSVGSEGNIFEFALPYVALALFMFILKWRDRRYIKRL